MATGGGANLNMASAICWNTLKQGMTSEAMRFIYTLQKAAVADEALTIYSLLQPIAILSSSSSGSSLLDALFPELGTIAAYSSSSVASNTRLTLYHKMLFLPPQNLKEPATNYIYYTPFITAVYHGNLSTVQIFLEHFNIDGLIEQTTIMRMPGPMSGQSDIVTDVTALWLAVYREHFHIVRMLLNYGADINARTSTGSTPLRVACFNCDQDMVWELLRCGADPNSVNIYGNSCLMLAANMNSLNIVAKLLGNGLHAGSEIVDVNQKARCGSTALHFHLDVMVRPGRVYEYQITQMLFKEGATYSTNHLGMTPLMYAGMSLALFSMYDRLLTLCGQAEVANAWDLVCCELINKGGRSPGWHLSEIEPPGSWSKNTIGQFMKMAFEYREKWNGRRPVGVSSKYRKHEEVRGPEEVRSFEEMEQLFEDSPVNIVNRLIQRLLTRERILGADNPELNNDRRSVAASACTTVFEKPFAQNVLFGLGLDAVGELRQVGFLSLALSLIRPLIKSRQGPYFRDGFSHGLMRLIMSTLRGFFQEVAIKNVFRGEPYRGQVDSIVAQLFPLLILAYIEDPNNETPSVATENHQLLLEFRHFTCLSTVDSCLVLDPLSRAITLRISSPNAQLAHEVLANDLIDLQVSLNRADRSSGATPLHHLMNTIHKSTDGEDMALRMRFLKRMLEKGAHPDVLSYHGTPGQYCDSGPDCINCAPARKLLDSYVTLGCLASRALVKMLLITHRGVNVDIPPHLMELVKQHGPFK